MFLPRRPGVDSGSRIDVPLIQIDPETDPRWDRFVEEHPKGLIYHLSGWKKVLEQSFRHQKGYYLCITEDDSIRAALPVFEVKSWILGNRLVSLPFTTLCDPLTSSIEECGFLLDGVFNLSGRLKTGSIEIRSFSPCGLSDDRFGRTDAYVHHYIDLKSPIDQIRKNFHRTCVRQRIDRALNSDLKIREGESIEDLRQFFSLYLTTRKRNGVLAQPWRFFQAMRNTFQPEGLFKLLLADYGDKTVGGIILLKYKNRVSVEFAASDDNYSNISPNHLLFWAAIVSSCSDGYEIFDFGRTSLCNRSLIAFKDRWATKRVSLPQFFYPKELSSKSAGFRQTAKYRLFSRLIMKSPYFTTRWIGEFCYGHMG